MSEHEVQDLMQVPPHQRRMMTPAEVAMLVSKIAGRTIAAYHKEYHTSWWKRVALRVAAEVQSFRMAVNEEYGPKHDRGELAWQKGLAAAWSGAVWVKQLPNRFLAPFRRAADAEIVHDFSEGEEDCAAEGSPAVKFTEGRAAKRRTS